MIPKKIHYCWFGGKEKSNLAKKCIESWKKYCSNFEIIEWNENNFDLDQHPYLKWCYENQKWAFLSDYARLLIIKEHGGIYFDTDVEVLRPLDELLKYDAFYSFENEKNVNTGQGFGATKNHPTVDSMIEQYEALQVNDDGSYPLIPCPGINTRALLSHGLLLNGKRQSLENIEIFSAEYFNPYDDPTGILRKTDRTYSIHWYSKSWVSKKDVLRSKITKPFHRLFGTDCFKGLKEWKKEKM